jgi:hypothetical protein
MKTLLAIASIATLASACVFEAEDGVSGDTLLVPADLELQWDASFNAVDDGLGAVIPVDVMVYDGATGEPRVAVEIELRPGGAASVLSEGELVRVDPDACDGCALFWDAWRDQYYAIEVDLEEATVTRLRTGPEGLVRAYVVIDSFDADGAGFAPVAVQVSTDASDDAFLLVPR